MVTKYNCTLMLMLPFVELRAGGIHYHLLLVTLKPVGCRHSNVTIIFCYLFHIRHRYPSVTQDELKRRILSWCFLCAYLFDASFKEPKVEFDHLLCERPVVSGVKHVLEQQHAVQVRVAALVGSVGRNNGILTQYLRGL